jgi:hypothetical protein
MMSWQNLQYTCVLSLGERVIEGAVEGVNERAFLVAGAADTVVSKVAMMMKSFMSMFVDRVFRWSADNERRPYV